MRASRTEHTQLYTEVLPETVKCGGVALNTGSRHNRRVEWYPYGLQLDSKHTVHVSKGQQREPSRRTFKAVRYADLWDSGSSAVVQRWLPPAAAKQTNNEHMHFDATPHIRCGDVFIQETPVPRSERLPSKCATKNKLPPRYSLTRLAKTPGKYSSRTSQGSEGPVDGMSCKLWLQCAVSHHSWAPGFVVSPGSTQRTGRKLRRSADW